MQSNVTELAPQEKASASTTGDPIALLTQQQLNVLDLSNQGLTAEQIGARLGIAPKTVKFHKTNIYKRLGVRNNIQALRAYQVATNTINVETELSSEGKLKYAALLAQSNRQANEIIKLKKELALVEAARDEARSTLSKQAAKAQARELKRKGHITLPFGNINSVVTNEKPLK